MIESSIATRKARSKSAKARICKRSAMLDEDTSNMTDVLEESVFIVLGVHLKRMKRWAVMGVNSKFERRWPRWNAVPRSSRYLRFFEMDRRHEQHQKGVHDGVVSTANILVVLLSPDNRRIRRSS